MKCPKCDGELGKVHVTGVEVDQCNKCSGIWFDFGELARVLTREDAEKLKKGAARNPAQDAQRGRCPRCGGTGNMIRMTSLAKPDIHIDSCSVCYGQWLDGGEFEALRKKGLFSTVGQFFKDLL